MIPSAVLKGVLDERTKYLMARVVTMLESASEAREFTAWSAAFCLGHQDPLLINTTPKSNETDRVVISAAFADEWAPNHASPTPYGGAVEGAAPHPLFDLASLTKPLLGGLSLAAFAPDPKQLRDVLERPGLVDRTLEPLLSTPATLGSNATLLDLASHRSGLPAWQWFGRGLYARESKSIGSLVSDSLSSSWRCGPVLDASKQRTFRTSLIKAFMAQRGTDAPLAAGKRPTMYSDCGYYVLARCLETLTGQTWGQRLGQLNAILGTTFAHASLDPAAARRAVPYHRYIVHECEDPEQAIAESTWFGPCSDTNANILANLQTPEPEVSLHAGLLGNASDVLSGMNALMALIRSLHETGCLDALRGDRFCYTLDTPTSAASVSAAPPEAWPRTFGHLGFSGVSMWGMFDESWAHHKTWVMLTNRTSGRRTVRSNPCPRLLRWDAQGTTGYAWREPGSTIFQAVSLDDWEEERSRLAGLHAILWDPEEIRPFADIKATRRTFSQAVLEPRT